MEYNWFDISNEDLNKWEGMCPPDEFRIITGSAIPYLLSDSIPVALFSQYNSVLIAGSAAPGGIVYFMANGNRVDTSGSAIDQMPFGLVFVGNSTSGSGCLIQHGNWVNRTSTPPSNFWNQISASGIAHYFPISEMPTEPAGKITDLKIDSQNAAFGKLVEILKNFVNAGK